MSMNSSDQNSSLFAIEVHGKWGYINSNGEKVIDYQFTYAGKFNSGVAWVYVGGYSNNGITPAAAIYHDGLWGLIDQTGKFIIKPRFNWLSGFYDGVAKVCQGTRVNIYGSDDFDSYPRASVLGACNFRALKHGSYLSPDAKFGMVSIDGKIIFEPQFDWITYPCNGMAVVCMGATYNFMKPSSPNHKVEMVGGKWGLVDLSGNFIFEPQFDEIIYDDGDCFDANHIWVKTDHHSQVINSAGQVLYKAQTEFYKINQFKNEVCWIEIKRNIEVVPQGHFYRGSNWGVLDLNKGLTEIPFLIFEIEELNNGMVWVKDGQNKLGLLDRKGNVLIEPKYECAILINNDDVKNGTDGTGYIWVKLAGKWGLLDRHFNYLIEPKYEELFKFTIHVLRHIQTLNTDLFWVQLNGKYGVINNRSEQIIEHKFEFDVTTVFAKGYSIVRKPLHLTKGKKFVYGVVNIQGDMIIEPKYISIGFLIDMDIFIVSIVGSDNPLYGIMDTAGNTIVEPKFKLLNTCGFGEWLLVWLTNHQRSLINKEGKLILNAYFSRVDIVGDLARLEADNVIKYVNKAGELVAQE